MTPDERLTAAVIIMRDAIEKHDAEVLRESASSPQKTRSASITNND